MSEEKNVLNTMLAGFIIGFIIFTSFYFLLEWLNNFLVTPSGKENPLRLPYSHLLALAGNILLFRKWIMIDKKENTAKGILLVSFLYLFVFFLFIKKYSSAL